MGFYASEAAAALLTDMMLSDVDVYCAKLAHEFSGVESEASSDITLTPATSLAWGTDTYNTTNHYNLIVQGDATTCFYGPVKDTTDTTIVFDATTMIDFSDGSAGAASDWGVGTTYNGWVYEKGSDTAGQWYGDYFGHCREISLGVEENYAEFERGIPKESLTEDLLQVKYMVKAKNFDVTNEDVWKAIVGGATRGSQTSQWEVQHGFTPAARSAYKITLVGTNRNNKTVWIQFYKGSFRVDGEINFSEEGYKSVGFTYNVKKCSLLPDAYNAFMIRVDE